MSCPEHPATQFTLSAYIFISRRPIGPVREIIKCPLSVRACVRSSRFYKSLSISKTIIARASKFAGYIHHWKNLPGNLFFLILKNKMAATGVNKMASVDFFSTLSKGLIAQKVLQLQFFREICCSATLSLAIRWYIVWGSIACHK